MTPEPNATIAPHCDAKGKFVEHIMLSISIVSDRTSAGQFDDSCAYTIEKALSEYHGIKSVSAEVLYHHTKIEEHSENCACHFCTRTTPVREIP